MDSGLCDEKPAKPEAAVARRSPIIPTAVLLREAGQFPLARSSTGVTLDPSPLAKLSSPQRRRRLVGILELLACHGDGSAAAEALRHHRWEAEMKNGKPPSRDSAGQSGDIKVIDDLRSPGQTPITPNPRFKTA